jgi:hypothetical protein
MTDDDLRVKRASWQPVAHDFSAMWSGLTQILSALPYCVM